jgi:serine/threonine protein kinase
MAPEIWLAKPYNEKVDIWSLGVVMYYLLTGAHPFEGESELLVRNIKGQ